MGAQINCVNDSGQTALIVAANQGNNDIIKVLLGGVAAATRLRKKETTSTYFGLLPLELAQKVDTYNNGLDPDIKDRRGKTALDYAEENLKRCQKENAERLLGISISQSLCIPSALETVELLKPITHIK